MLLFSGYTDFYNLQSVNMEVPFLKDKPQDDSNVYTMSIVDGSRIITTIDKKNGEIRNQKKISGASPRKGHWTLYNNTQYWGGGDQFL